jgi:hypothetical protein
VIPQELPFYHLLAPASDAAGRSSAFLSLKNALKAWIVCYVNQGNAATVALTVNQAKDVAGTGAKAIDAARIWAKLDPADPDFVTEAHASSYTTDAALKAKLVVFELSPEDVLDVANDFDCVRVSTGPSNAANITSALLVILPRHGGATVPSPLVD